MGRWSWATAVFALGLAGCGAPQPPVVPPLYLAHEELLQVKESKPFDQAKWGSEKWDRPLKGRAEMVHDLVDHHLRGGMPEAEIEALLGHPDSSDYDFTVDDEKRVLVYELYRSDTYGMPTLRLVLDGQGNLANPYLKWRPERPQAFIDYD